MNKRMCKKLGTWFECCALFVNVLDGGVSKRTVCVGAMSFAEAENTALNYFKKYYSGVTESINELKIAYNITSISIASYKEVIFREGCEGWFKASMKNVRGEKAVVLLLAKNIMDAHNTLEERLTDPAQQWKITKLGQTDIVTVVSHDAIIYDEAPTE